MTEEAANGETGSDAAGWQAGAAAPIWEVGVGACKWDRPPVDLALDVESGITKEETDPLWLERLRVRADSACAGGAYVCA